jgi:DnaK suppressor protein
MLTTEQTAALREQLEGDRRRILENAEKALELTMNRDRDMVGRDPIDESVEEALYATQLRLHDREKFLLEKIDDALRRLEAGQMDECESCGEPIGFKRLLARPVTTMCIVCKEEHEREEVDVEPEP